METGYDDSNLTFPFLEGEGAQSFLDKDPNEVALQVAKYISYVTGLNFDQSGLSHQGRIGSQQTPGPRRQ